MEFLSFLVLLPVTLVWALVESPVRGARPMAETSPVCSLAMPRLQRHLPCRMHTPAAAPCTPDWLRSFDTPSLAPCPSTELARSAFANPRHFRGTEALFSWPHYRHALHFGCFAHLVANVCELRCPTCGARWPPEAANAFTTACRAHGVEAPQPAPDHETQSHQYHESRAPRPPSHILPFC